MEKILISDEAYAEFKSFLDENEVTDYVIRLNLAGFGCSGPAFNISVDKEVEGDVVEKVKEITFLIEPDLIQEFGGFKILSAEENNGNGLSLKPFIEPENSGCGSCSGGCH